MRWFFIVSEFPKVLAEIQAVINNMYVVIKSKWLTNMFSGQIFQVEYCKYSSKITS